MTACRYFTMVFEGDLADHPQNPFHVDTPYGRPLSIAKGDVIEEADALRDQQEGIASGYAFWGGAGCGIMLAAPVQGSVALAVAYGLAGAALGIGAWWCGTRPR